MAAPKLYTIEEFLSEIPEPPSGRKPGSRIILQRARELGACVDFGRAVYLREEDMRAILESFRPCSNQSDVKANGTGQHAGQSTADELSAARNALARAMHRPNVGGSKQKLSPPKVVPIKGSQ